ncbi:hypothetical protein COT42_05070 [Candidatus Saganbacteria bacterium CG08_land_8_20_14_0_20_45_16]|uniref:LPS-assembly protein LptD n=1 Tax=Candidatus Saganbacteria bacterium CG08_land_8_20_14_0_20_45_16 TaxID=2014293 RepID=A0A2H0XX69_UNCSA|nr:MAG: hypothetical protein COT42_05070 [Candidatus Saganbacteria bacterium CG08_land_8_20_14_0_20_45_16]
MKPLLIVFLLFFSPLAALAQINNLVINGDNVSYNQESQLYQAEGSVEVFYKDITIYGQKITYDTSTEVVSAEAGFTLIYEGIKLQGERLRYLLPEKTGQANRVTLLLRGVSLTGQQVQLGKEELSLNGASFTTCDLPGPHYHVTANEIVVYPKFGWLVAYWGYFWLGRLPLVPMPTYIYDMLADGKEHRNVPPFPEVGSNDEDGTYVNERLAWYAGRQLSGTYSLNYAAKKGFGGGAEANYIMDENSRGSLRLYGNPTDAYWGGLTHWLFFGQEINAGQDPFSFFELPKHREYELELDVTYHERINYERVSYWPNLTLRQQSGHFFSKALTYELELGLARIREENNVTLNRGLGRVKLFHELNNVWGSTLVPALGFEGRYYSGRTQWTKSLAQLDLKRNFGQNWSLGLGYLHYFSVAGQSPFNFENYRFRAADSLQTSLSLMNQHSGLGLATAYYLDTWQPEDIDYSVFIGQHCYDIILKYRSLRREFELGFALTADQ